MKLKKLYQSLFFASMAFTGLSAGAQVHISTSSKPPITADMVRKLKPADASDSASLRLVAVQSLKDYKLASPAFPGGDDSLTAYLERNIQYPEAAKKDLTRGIVKVSFVIDTTGKVCDIRLRQDIGDDCGAEIVRVLAGMPHWVPGKNPDGSSRRTEALISVNFDLDNIIPLGVNLDPNKPEADEGDFEF